METASRLSDRHPHCSRDQTAGSENVYHFRYFPNVCNAKAPLNITTDTMKRNCRLLNNKIILYCSCEYVDLVKPVTFTILRPTKQRCRRPFYGVAETYFHGLVKPYYSFKTIVAFFLN